AVDPDHLVLGVDPGAEPADGLAVHLDPARADELLAVPAAAHPGLGQDLLQPDPARDVGQRVPVLVLEVVLVPVTVGRSHPRCPQCSPAGTGRDRADPPGWPGPAAPGSTRWSGTRWPRFPCPSLLPRPGRAAPACA